jgi:sugar (pentulose or hexulose) kinase
MGAAASLSGIRNWVQFSRVQQPVPEHAAAYDLIYPLYTELYRSLTGAFDEVARLQREMEK